MKKEFIVERQGKSFVLYAGLLAEAHDQGLKSIHTELVQVPSEANNRVAICVATVVLEKDGIERTFTGIGDAAPNNVAPAMQSCLIRMAETRCKARALRDAVNVGVTALEEMDDASAMDDAPESGYAAPRRSAPRRQAAQVVPAAAKPKANPNGLLTEAQLTAITNLCQRKGKDADAVCQSKHGLSAQNLSQAQASELIAELNKLPNVLPASA